ncbi:MAG: ABC transporter ATP-binding protein [Acidobacteriota bacterium]
MLFPPAAPPDRPPGPREFLGVFRYGVRALGLVWSTHRGLSVALGILTLAAGLLPAGATYVGKLIVDAVQAAVESGSAADRLTAFRWVGVEAVIVITLAGAQRGLSVCQSLLRALLGHRVNVLVLEKALTLRLSHFEDAEVYDQMTRARREASSRPLSLVTRTFGLIQNAISLSAFAGLLFLFSPWAVLALVLAGLPAFVAETKFSGDAFRLFRWRSPETRKQAYLEMVMAREDYVKEVQLFQLGPLLMQRYRDIFDLLHGKDRVLTIKRNFWGFVLGLVGIATVVGAHLFIVADAVAGLITLGDMLMFMLVFKQGQSAVAASLQAIGGMYEDNLYLSNLYEFLELEVTAREGEAVTGPQPEEGLVFDDVSFSYPGSTSPTLHGVSFRVRPGEKLALVGENGAGKTTLIKLLTRLHDPSAGRILLEGRDLREWDESALRQRIGVIFQDFVRYQFSVGENIGAGDVRHFDERPRWESSAEKGLASPFIDEMPRTYDTQLGRWFKDGRELSTGQWQKMALSRAFMREEADILVLDEPTASMDAEAEAQVFERFAKLTEDQMAILISHRFSTVRLADRILVLDGGRVIEEGPHRELMDLDGRYARLFTLQAEAYQ